MNSNSTNTPSRTSNTSSTNSSPPENNPFVSFRRTIDASVASAFQSLADLRSRIDEVDRDAAEAWHRFNRSFERAMNPERRATFEIGRDGGIGEKREKGGNGGKDEGEMQEGKRELVKLVETKEGHVGMADWKGKTQEEEGESTPGFTHSPGLALLSPPRWRPGNEFFAFSRYSPLRLECGHLTAHEGSRWRDAFEDLLHAQQGDRLLPAPPDDGHIDASERLTRTDTGPSYLYGDWTSPDNEFLTPHDGIPIARSATEWLTNLTRKDLVSGRLRPSFVTRMAGRGTYGHGAAPPCWDGDAYEGQLIPLLPLLDTALRIPMLMLGHFEKNNDNNKLEHDEGDDNDDEDDSVTELDMYEHFLAHHQSSLFSLPSFSSTDPQPPSEEDRTKNTGTRPNIIATLSRTERRLLPDGSVTTTTLLKRRFADGTEEANEEVETTAAPVPVRMREGVSLKYGVDGAGEGEIESHPQAQPSGKQGDGNGSAERTDAAVGEHVVGTEVGKWDKERQRGKSWFW